MTTVLQIAEIVSDPQIRGGRPVIAGTGIRVMDIAGYRDVQGLSAEDIASQFSLSLGQVYAALAYYHLHNQEIDKEIQADAEDAERLRQSFAKQGRLITLE